MTWKMLLPCTSAFALIALCILPTPDAEALGCPALASVNVVRFDFPAEPLRFGAVTRLGTARWRAPNEVRNLLYAPNGKYVASICLGGTTQIWDVDDGRPLRFFQHESYRLSPAALAFTPECKQLVTIRQHDNEICIWDIQRRTLATHSGRPCSSGASQLAIRADGVLALGTLDGDVLLGANTHRPRWARLTTLDGVSSLAFSPAGATLAAGADGGMVCLWNTTDSKKLFSHDVQGAFAKVAFSPDGKFLAVGARDKLVLLNALTGAVVREFAGARGDVSALRWMADGKRLLVGSWVADQTTVTCWDMATGKRQFATSHKGQTCCLDLSPNGIRVVSSHFSHKIEPWDAATGKSLQPRAGHALPVSHIAFLPDGLMIATAGEDRELRLWDTARGNCLRCIDLKDDIPYVGPRLFAREGTLFTTWHPANGFAAWQIPGTKFARTAAKTPSSARFMGTSADGRIALFFDQKKTSLWEIDKTACIRIFQHDRPVRKSRLSPDGKWLATTDWETIEVWNTKSGARQSIYTDANGQLDVLDFTPDSAQLLAAVYRAKEESSDCIAYDLTKEVLWRINVAGDSFAHAAFAPDGQLVALCTWNGKIQLRECSSQLLLCEFDPFSPFKYPRLSVPRALGAVAFSRTGGRMAVAMPDCTVLIWDWTHSIFGVDAKTTTLGAVDLEGLWRYLATGDGPTVFRTQAVMTAAADKTIAFLKTRLEPTPHVQAGVFEQLAADLGSPKFAIREGAMKALANLGDAIEPQLRVLALKAPSLEVRYRAERLLAALEVSYHNFPSETLRTARALQVLERIDSPASRQLLEHLATGAPGARQTRLAAAACKRFRA